MAKNKLLDNLIVVSMALSQIAVGLALVNGILPIVLFGWIVNAMILQVAGWVIVGTTVWGLVQKGMKMLK